MKKIVTNARTQEQMGFFLKLILAGFFIYLLIYFISAPGYQPPQPYQAPPPRMQPVGPTTTTIITPPTPIIVNMVFGESPVSMVCPHCQTHIITCTTYQDGTLTWLSAGALLLLGCWLGCCLIPFCLDGCKDVIHSCPNCHARLGSYRRM